MAARALDAALHGRCLRRCLGHGWVLPWVLPWTWVLSWAVWACSCCPGPCLLACLLHEFLIGNILLNDLSCQSEAHVSQVMGPLTAMKRPSLEPVSTMVPTPLFSVILDSQIAQHAAGVGQLGAAQVDLVVCHHPDELEDLLPAGDEAWAEHVVHAEGLARRGGRQRWGLEKRTKLAGFVLKFASFCVVSVVSVVSTKGFNAGKQPNWPVLRLSHLSHLSHLSQRGDFSGSDKKRQPVWADQSPNPPLAPTPTPPKFLLGPPTCLSHLSHLSQGGGLALGEKNNSSFFVVNFAK